LKQQSAVIDPHTFVAQLGLMLLRLAPSPAAVVLLMNVVMENLVTRTRDARPQTCFTVVTISRMHLRHVGNVVMTAIRPVVQVVNIALHMSQHALTKTLVMRILAYQHLATSATLKHQMSLGWLATGPDWNLRLLSDQHQ
jgi:hypothetical protein